MMRTLLRGEEKTMTWGIGLLEKEYSDKI
jgi:hypothetical protein